VNRNESVTTHLTPAGTWFYKIKQVNVTWISTSLSIYVIVEKVFPSKKIYQSICLVQISHILCLQSFLLTLQIVKITAIWTCGWSHGMGREWSLVKGIGWRFQLPSEIAIRARILYWLRDKCPFRLSLSTSFETLPKAEPIGCFFIKMSALPRFIRILWHLLIGTPSMCSCSMLWIKGIRPLFPFGHNTFDLSIPCADYVNKRSCSVNELWWGLLFGVWIRSLCSFGVVLMSTLNNISVESRPWGNPARKGVDAEENPDWLRNGQFGSRKHETCMACTSLLAFFATQQYAVHAIKSFFQVKWPYQHRSWFFDSTAFISTLKWSSNDFLAIKQNRRVVIRFFPRFIGTAQGAEHGQLVWQCCALFRSKAGPISGYPGFFETHQT
jgi:hypothetical protein